MKRPVILLAWLAACLGAIAQDQVLFSRDIAPLVTRRCVACHGPDKDKGGYRLHTFHDLMQPGDSGQPVVIPGKPEKSLLYQLVASSVEEDRMPQKGEPLDARELFLIKRWIETGAAFDGADPRQVFAPPTDSLAPAVSPTKYRTAVPIQAVRFSADGTWLYVSAYAEIIAWNVPDGTVSKRFPNLPERITSLHLHPQKNLLLFTGGTPGRSGVLGVIDLESGKVRTVARFPESVPCATWNTDGSIIAAGTADGALRFYQGDTGEPAGVHALHADWITAVAFSRHQPWVATASRDRTARIFNLSNQQLEATFVQHEAAVRSVIFGPDSKLIVSSGADRKTYQWKPDGQSQGSMEPKEEFIRWESTEEFLVGATKSGDVHQYRWKEKKPMRRLGSLKESVTSLAIDRSGSRIAAGTLSGHVSLWNLQTGNEEVRFYALPK